MEYKDYYAILGVEKTASVDEIKKAYRTLVKKYHPDSAEKTKENEEKFKEISEAYEVLKDPEKRKKYDDFGSASNFSGGSDFDPSQYGYNVSYSGNASDFSDFFDMIFGQGFGGSGFYSGQTNTRRQGNPFSGAFRRGGRSEAQPSANVPATEVKISLYEAYSGTERMMSVNSAGDTKQLKIKIPAGIKDGEKMRIKTAGGTAEIKISVEGDGTNKLEGNDIIQELKVPCYDAVLGRKASIKTIGGATISVNIKPGTTSGKKLKIPKQGFKDRKGNVGDLYVRIIADIPENPSQQEKKLYEELKKLHTN